MDNIQQILKEFKAECKKIYAEKGYYICKTNKGLRKVKKYSGSREMLLFENDIRDNLLKKNYNGIDKFYLSIYQKPYVLKENNYYVMSDYTAYTKSDYNNVEHVNKIAEELGLIHKLTIGTKFNDKIIYNKGLIREGEKAYRKLKYIKKHIGKNTHYSDFDIIFLKNYEYYLDKIEYCIKSLKNTKYEILLEEAKTRIFVSHNLIKEESIVYIENKIHINDFSRGCVTYPIIDLKSLIERNIKKSDNINLYEIINRYNKTNILTNEDLKILYIILNYPTRFIKISNEYYSKKRSFIPNYLINSLEKAILVEEKQKKFIKILKEYEV